VHNASDAINQSNNNQRYFGHRAAFP
jgi:hypothetical protein